MIKIKDIKIVSDESYLRQKEYLQKLGLPSKTFHCHWLQIENPLPYPKPTKDAGKLLLFFSIDKIDLNWKRIRLGTILGELGYKSKVKTAKLNPKYSKSKSKPICIYFYDFNDKKDIKRIKKCLRKDLSIKQKPKIKLNKVTLEEMKNDRNNSEKKIKTFTNI